MSEQISTKNRFGASTDAISAHYDKGDEFFQLWIGPDLIYSSALFDAPELQAGRALGMTELERAQFRKLDHHIEAAGAAGAARVLDIGCGWGALLRRLVNKAGVRQAVGLTLSPSQAKWIRRNPDPRIEVIEEDWRKHRPQRPYDAIISIGAFEHFVHPGLDGETKLNTYREFFDFCHRNLVDCGRLSLQTIAYVAPAPPSQFMSEKIFPDSELPMIWEPAAAAQPKFELLALRNDREHYYHTLRVWERNLLKHRKEAVALVGEQVVEDFHNYLRLSAAAFGYRAVCLLRMSFLKRA